MLKTHTKLEKNVITVTYWKEVNILKFITFQKANPQIKPHDNKKSLCFEKIWLSQSQTKNTFINVF